MTSKKIGIIGYGSLGQFLHKQIDENPQFAAFEVVFIWNRTSAVLDEKKIESTLRLNRGNLLEGLKSFFEANTADIIIEAAHPDVVKEVYNLVIKQSDFFVTSLTAFADSEFLEYSMSLLNSSNNHGQLVLPTGAGWGLKDIQRMSAVEKMEGLTIEMYFHQDALKVKGLAKENLSAYVNSNQREPSLIAEGNITEIARQAPNNSNTMMSIWMTCREVDRFKVKGKLFAQKSTHNHIVKIRVSGPEGYSVELVRTNPAKEGAVTGNMTFSSFASSLLEWGQEGSNGFYVI